MKSSLWILAVGFMLIGCGPKSEAPTAQADKSSTAPSAQATAGATSDAGKNPDAKSSATPSAQAAPTTPPTDKAPSKEAPNAAGASPSDSYTLKVTAKPGEKIVYLTTYTLQQGQNSRPMNLNETVTVKAGTEGHLTLVTGLNDLNMGKALSPKAKAQFAQYKSTIEIDSLNNTLKSSYAGPQAVRALIDQIGGNPTEGIVFPDHPVKVGDSWTGKVPPANTVSTFKLTRVEDSNGKKIAVIETTTPSSANLKPLAPVIFRIDLSDGLLSGQVVKMEAKSPSGPITITLELNRK